MGTTVHQTTRHISSRTRVTKKGFGPIPPKHHDTTSGDTLRLRMRFLSVSGYQSEDLGDGHDGRAHLVLKSLDPIVKANVEKRFRGLKPQSKNR
ncbi:hypothetical protein PHPALM_28716 [Phytophthora palmivora]|uniref:Uncharacterized protein n=1 Tax=Phytophthora palmivora TaxID=4796 RepID=A0A2P4X9D4_9STRA|nr:hypothetical protein PHPALM_28716 [Phytophthora palmivora]